MIDTLMFRMRDIANLNESANQHLSESELISYAVSIASTFVRKEGEA